MNYQYKIYEKALKEIISGQKTIEFRLLNEKSSNAHIKKLKR